MGSRWWRPLVSGANRGSTPAPRPPRKPLALEYLEARLAPAVDLVSFAASGSSASGDGISVATNLGSISDDGRYVAYVSGADDLVSGQTDTADSDDVFLFDRQENTTTLISRKAGTSTTAGGGTSYTPSISGDGKWVAFVSEATDLISGVTSSGEQVYLYDVVNDSLSLVTYKAGSTTLASQGYGAAIAQPSLSKDGRYLAFLSGATDLISGYSDGHDSNTISYLTNGYVEQAFLYDREATSDKIKLISHISGDTETGGNEHASQVTVSRDGVAVAFTSYATNLGHSEIRESTSPDIFRYDIATGDVSLVSYDASASGTDESGASQSDTDFSPPSISADGRYIVYASKATSLVDDQVDPDTTYTVTIFGFTLEQTGPDLDVFLYDNNDQSTTLVSLKAGTTATAADGAITSIAATANNRPVISADGKWVAFASPSDELMSLDATAGDKDNVYLYEVATGTITLVSHTDDGDADPASGDSPTISGDGKYVAFASTTTAPDIYRFTRSDGSLELFSPSTATGAPPSGGVSTTPSISDDGAVIAWNSSATNLVADDDNDAIDVFINAVASTTPTAILINLGGNPITSVPETPDTPFGTLSTDISGGSYTFTLVSGTGSTDNGSFTITNGQIQTGPNFPPAGQTSFQIRVRAQDNNNPGIVIEKPIQLGLITKPTAILPSITRVPASPSFTFATLGVTAAGSGRQFNFALVNGEGDGDNGRFQIINDNGAFKIQTKPDFPPAGQLSFSIRVRVTDATYTSLTYEQSFTISVATTPTQISITSDKVPALTGSLVGRLSGTAPGGERPFSFTLVSGSGDTDNGHFSIDSNGDLTTGATFPDGSRQTYSIRVRASDKDYPSQVNYEQTFSITAIQAPSGITLSRATIPAEANADGGSFATQGDSTGRTYTYSLVSGSGDTDNGRFTVTSAGVLRTGDTFPDGSRLSYSTRVRTADSVFPGLFFDKTFTVTALPDPTDITLTSSIIEAAPDAAGGTFDAVADGTGRQFTFTLVAGLGDADNAKFRITAGQLKVAPDFVAGSQVEHSIRVRVSDPDYPSVSYDEVFTISAVKAPNDILLSPQVVPPEPNTDVGALTAQGGSAGRAYTYTLVSGSGSDDNGLFTVTSAGVLRTGATFPDGSRIGYSVRVRATDSDFPALTFEKALTVTTRRWEDKVGGFQMTGGDAVTSAEGVSVTSLAVDRQDVGIQAVISIAAGSNKSAGLIARYSGPGEQNFYLAEAYGRPGLTNQVEINLYRQALGQLTLLGRTTVAGASADGTFRFEVVGAMQKVFFADKLVLFANDTLLDGAGGVGLRASGPAGGVRMDDIAYQPESGPVPTSSFTDDFSTNYTSADMGQLSWQYAEQAGTNIKIDTSTGTATNNTPFAIASLRGLSEKDQVVTAAVTVAASTGGSIGLMTRYTGPGEQNFYLAELYGMPGTGDNVQVSIYRNVAGAYTKLTSGTLAAHSVTHTLTGTLRFEVSGPALKVFLGDDLVAFARDTVLEGTGPSSAGFRITGPAGAASVGTFSASKLSSAAATLPHDDAFETADRRQLGPKYVEQVGNFRVDPGLAADTADGRLLNNASLAIATLSGLSTDKMTIKLDIAAGSLAYGSNRSVALLGRYNGTGEGTGYLAELYARPDLTGTVVANLYRRSMGGSLTLLGSATTSDNSGTMEFVLDGPSLTLKMDGAELLTASDTTYSAGSAGFRVTGRPGDVSLDNFRVTSP